MGWREEFPELADAFEKVGPGSTVKDFGKAVRGRRGRPPGSKNRSDAMTRVGRQDGLEEYMRIAGKTRVGDGSYRAYSSAHSDEK